MANQLANIAMNTEASIQVLSSAEADVVKEATTFLDNDVNHWLEASQAEYHETQRSARDDATKPDHLETILCATALGCSNSYHLK